MLRQEFDELDHILVPLRAVLSQVAEHVVPAHELVVGVPRGIPRAADSDGLEHARVPKLLDNLLRVEFVG